MPLDREAVLKQAEKLLRQGKLDGAIQEYVRLVEDQPKDWNSINALGDLYARAGDAGRAVEQFSKIADHLYTEGFIPKAVALYKKALKTKGDDEPVLAKLAVIAGRQGLIADARHFFRQLAALREAKGDARGAAECLISLGTLEDADVESRLTAARAAQKIGDLPQAAAILKDAARALEKEGRAAEALEALVDAAQLDPQDLELRTRLARECVRAGQPDRARLFLTLDVAGDDPELLLLLARLAMADGDDQRGRLALMRLLTIAPAQHDAVLALARDLAAAGHADRAHGCVDVLADAAILSGQWDRAMAALQWFSEAQPDIQALSRLVEVCVEAGREEALRDAQSRLADAYLAAGRADEARVIAEDLVDRDPRSREHVTRLRQALVALGVEHPDQVIADRIAPAPEVDLTGEIPEPVDVAPPEPVAEDEPEAIVLEAMEIDLSNALAEMGAVPPPQPAPPGPPAPSGVEGPKDLESVFEDIRSRVSRDQQAEEAAAQLERGTRLLDEGRLDEALADLQAAARVPMFRFRAGAALGRLHIARGELEAGIEWLERAAQAPAPAPEDGYALLYELADVLELLGESARALAVLMELEADAAGYRDVRSRIERLTRVQAGSPGA